MKGPQAQWLIDFERTLVVERRTDVLIKACFISACQCSLFQKVAFVETECVDTGMKEILGVLVQIEGLLKLGQ